jgi:hypothetical protein
MQLFYWLVTIISCQCHEQPSQQNMVLIGLSRDYRKYKALGYSTKIAEPWYGLAK